MCRSSAGKEPRLAAAPRRGCSSSAGKTLPWDGTFFRPGLVARGGVPGSWGGPVGAGLSRLEDELRRLSPSLPGPTAKPRWVWKEATRVLAVPSGRAVARVALRRLRSTGLGAGLGPVVVPEWGGWQRGSGRWLWPVPEGSGDTGGEPGASSPSSASNDFLSAGDREREMVT